jgi:membrane-associated phospholipid phosphatase
MLQMNLYPFDSKSADTPSYPSGHTFNSKIYCAVLGNKYPKYFQNLLALAQDCSDSRMYMGLHYASDCAFGSYAADCILDHPEFKKKYKL